MTPGVIIFWHFVFAFIGALVGIVIGYRMKKEPSKPTIPTPTPSAQADPGALRAGWGYDGKVWLEMNGIHLVNKAELTPDQQKRLTTLVQELTPWVDAGKAAEPAPLPAPAAPMAPAAPVAPRKVSLADKKEIAPAPAPVMESIIQQINGVLQVKLAASAFKDRGIQLVEGPGGSVIVEDGLNNYEGIDAVPEADIKALIRDSVTEWEHNTK